MSKILTPWTQQPQVPVGIDWSNANASGLIRAYLPQGVGYRDKVREEYLAGVGINSFSTVCNDGLVVCRPISQGRVTFTSPTNAGVARCVTFITSNISADAWGNLEVIAGDNGGFGENIAFQTSTTTLNVNVGSSVVTSYALSGNRNVVTVRRTETTSEIWVNGKQRTSVTHASGPLIHTNTSFGWAQQKIPLILIHSNFLADAAISSLHNNPWQIFKPLQRRIFVPIPSAGGLYTLIAQSGNYSLLGKQATLLRHRSLSAQSGSYSITGLSASISYVPVATVYTLTAQAGSYALSGVPAQLSKHRNLIASTGSYSLVGQLATLSRTSLTPVYTLTALPGAYSLSGNQATLLRHRSLNAAAGNYTYTGKSISISKYTPGSGTLVKYLNVLTGEVLILKPI